MRSRWLVNLLLLMAIGALTLIARYEPGIDKAQSPQAITALTQDDLHSIRVQRPVREDLELRRAGDGTWQIAREPAVPADDFQVNALARLATQTAVRSYPAAELELARLQLDPPQATVYLNDTRIDFGSLEPLEGLRYVRTGDTVHLVPDLYQHLLEADAIQFARRRLLPADAAIAAVRLPGLSLARSGDRWQLEPQQAVSADAIQRLVDAWRDASALQVRAAEGSEDGEAIDITLGDGETVSFIILSRQPELVLARPALGIVYGMGARGGALLQLEDAGAEQD